MKASFGDNYTIDIVSWWERKRVYFNLFAGVTGLVTLTCYLQSFGLFELFGVIMWGIVANVLYSFGLLWELLAVYYIGEYPVFCRLRWPLFVIGTIAYCLVSYRFVFNYCL